MDHTIEFTLNGETRNLTEIDKERDLLSVLRKDFELVSCKCGCGQGQCGACTVLVNGKAVRSCQLPLKSVIGKEVVTFEGLDGGNGLSQLMQAFEIQDAIRCGYCTSGMILKAYSLMKKKPNLSRLDIVNGMQGHLCRCGAYGNIIDAIEMAATFNLKNLLHDNLA